MRKMVMLPTACILLIAGCIVSTPDMTGEDTLGYFEFVQNGETVVQSEGIVILDRSPFEIMFSRAGWVPSLIAARPWDVLQQCRGFPPVMTTLIGTGMAVAENDLEVLYGPLECYEGWSASFEENWGGVYRSNRSDYDEYRSGLDDEPILLVSGRDYDFSNNGGGAPVHRVERIGGIPIERTIEKQLVLLLFMEESDLCMSQPFYPLFWGCVILRFRY